MSIDFVVGQLRVTLYMHNGEGSLKSSFVNQQGWFLQLVAPEPPNLSNSQDHQIVVAVEQFAYVLVELVGLPPKRNFDHQIPLKDGTRPISVGLYRYPHYQKTEIGNIVSNLLKLGIVRSSQSIFSSPVLLVKKVDDT